MHLLFLAYADQRQDLPAIREEADKHYSLLTPGVANNHFKIHRDRAATIDTISRYLTAFRKEVFLFHYSGHAGQSILELEAAENARAAGIAHLLAQCPNLQLVVLNGCCTAGQVRQLRAAGVTATIIATHVPVGDRTAARFSEVFYQTLQSGESVQQAFEQGIGAALLSKQAVTVHRGIKLDHLPGEEQAVWGIFPTAAHAPGQIRLPGSQLRKIVPLPAVSYFFGREAELADTTEQLQEELPVAIAISGGPGVGKSTLCLSTMHQQRIAEKYGDRRLFVSCDGATTTDQVIVELARILGLPIGPDLEDRLWSKLQRGPYLIAIDNAETPLAGDRESFEAFLRRLFGTGTVMLLLTIRGIDLPFGIRWSRHIKLKPVTQQEGKAIFLATAGEDFREDPLLDRIVRALDRLPLALVLMAGQAIGEDHLAPLFRRWERQKTKLLRRGKATSRLTNLELSIALTLEGPTMTEAGWSLFRLLSVLPDGIHRDELAQLGPDDGEAGARTLVASGLAGYVDQRLQMLAPIRSFGEANYFPRDAILPVIQHYCDLAAWGDQVGREQGAEAAERISRELRNIEKMISYAFMHLPEAGIRAAIHLSQFSLFTGLGDRSLLRAAYEKAGAMEWTELKAKCVWSLGNIAFRESDNAGARALFEQAIPLYDQVGDVRGKANCVGRLGNIAFIASDNAGARALYEDAIPLYDQVGDLGGKANCVLSLGRIAFIESDNAGARALFEQAIPLYDQVGDLLGKANCVRSLGDIAFITSDNTGARVLFEEAIPLYDQVGDLLGKAYCVQSLGEIAFRESDHAGARALFEEAIPLYEQVGDLLGKANCVRSLGNVAFIESDHAGARVLFEEAIPLYDQVGDLLGKANCVHSLGEIAFRESDKAGARALFEEALPLYDQVGSLLGKANCVHSLGKIAFRASDHAGARALFEEAIPLFDQVGDLLGQANCFWGLGDLQKAEGDPALARSSWLTALEMYRQIGNLYSIRVMYAKLATVTDGEERERYQALEEEVGRRLEGKV